VIPRTWQHNAGSMITRVPDFHSDGTLEPHSTMLPTTSCPSTNGVEMNGEKYGLPLQAIAERSDPQTPLKRVFILTHSGDGIGGGGKSFNSMHDSAPLATDDQCDASARTSSQRGTDLKN
jgi:hypothetical protein